jgi:hypothetical protein
MNKKDNPAHLKDLEIRVKLPWKEDPTTANRLYKRITLSLHPEETARQIKKELNESK